MNNDYNYTIINTYIINGVYSICMLYDTTLLCIIIIIIIIYSLLCVEWCLYLYLYIYMNIILLIIYYNYMQLILPHSTWAIWAGTLSDAIEIHVGMPPYHHLVPNNPAYIYHDEQEGNYFGFFNKRKNAFQYRYTGQELPPKIV